MHPSRQLRYLLTATLAATLLAQAPAAFADSGRLKANARAVIDHWTPARMASAIPRDMVIDHRGLGYLRLPDGSLRPHGHAFEALSQAPRAKPSGGSDTTPPSIDSMSPADGSVLTSASQTFSATVSDGSGVRSVAFEITYPAGNTQSFSANATGNNVWTLNLQGFSDGAWGWQVVARDRAKPGNTATSQRYDFTIDLGGTSEPPPADGVVTNSPWTDGGAVQTAAGRIYFEMPTQRRVRGKPTLVWNGYVCSGTVATDDTSGRSVILTAAHCVYEDVEKMFARNVLFIPNQAGSASGTDTVCSNDPLGCWAPSFGVVDTPWTTTTFPSNIPWDYAYYVVPDSGAHQGGLQATGSEVLDAEAGSLAVQFTPPATGDVTHALGYSYSDDPNFMYCAEAMTTEGDDNWWLPSCGLSGGASGGPWIQPMDSATGSGPIISVNSWGYTSSPGMAGPILSGTTARCLFDTARSTGFDAIATEEGAAGVIGCN